MLIGKKNKNIVFRIKSSLKIQNLKYHWFQKYCFVMNSNYVKKYISENVNNFLDESFG